MVWDGGMKIDLAECRERYQPDRARIDRARQRQRAVFKGEKPDAWPIVLTGPLTPEQERIPQPNFKEAFDDIDLMICGQLRAACAAANGGADAVPSVRGNYGTGVCLSCLGLEQEVFPDKMPWLQRHLSLEEVAKLTPDAIRIQGTFERGLEFMRRHRELMGDRLPAFCMDTQGPFDLAHLLIGDAVFLLPYDDPGLMHHVMEICLELGIRTHTWMKEVSGEPMDACYHGCQLYAENFGIRICEDTTAILGPDLMETFALPYTQRLAAHFGGAWVHYCGRNDHLTEKVLRIPEVRAINFGHIPGHLHDHVFEEDMQRCLDAGKVYFGNFHMREGERPLEYIKRLHSWASQGCLIPAMHGWQLEWPAEETPRLLETWYSL